jgi:hypothetical protein
MIKIINPELTRIVNKGRPGQYSSRPGSPNLKAQVIRAVELGQVPANGRQARLRHFWRLNVCCFRRHIPRCNTERNSLFELSISQV